MPAAVDPGAANLAAADHRFDHGENERWRKALVAMFDGRVPPEVARSIPLFRSAYADDFNAFADDADAIWNSSEGKDDPRVYMTSALRSKIRGTL